MLYAPTATTTDEGKNMTTTMMTAASITRSTMFHDAAQEKERIAMHEEKKDQAVDDEDNKFILNTNQNHNDQQEDRSDITRIQASRVSSGLDRTSNPNDSLRRRRRSSSPTSLKVSTAAIDVILPSKDYDSSLILRSFSSDSMQAINKTRSEDPDFDRGIPSTTAAEAAPIPRRNLTEAFEDVYIKPSKSWTGNGTESPGIAEYHNVVGKRKMSGSSNMISPTGVAELNTTENAGPVGETATSHAGDPKNLITPIKSGRKANPGVSDDMKQKQFLPFRLHPQLQREMSDALVQRVCFYSIIHDINKEATSMASNDDSDYNRNPNEANEKSDPLVRAAHGHPRLEYSSSNSVIRTALIDEEQWLLDAIESRSPDEARSMNTCPPTFLQAIGERDYENPLTSLSNGSRTQLWKPSRSWWEAKSGKNPWIEPTSHNKRWRYLWPLIHYHKFLAKCIKKLKRNGICVKSSFSPVSVYLREEVCAVSDHLASVSLFDSDEWMDCLQHFEGWMESSEEAASHSRELIATLKLRSLNEPGDVDSALLRSQIDEQYLRAMVNARAQLAGNEGVKDEKRATKEPMKRRDRSQAGSGKSSSSISSVGAEAPRPRQISTHNPKGRTASSGPRRNWQGYNHHPGWWQNGWQQHGAYPYGDDMSVHSTLSCDTSYSHGYMNNFNHGAVPSHPQYYPSMMYNHGMHGGAYPPSVPPNTSMYPGEAYDPHHMDPAGWMRHPSMGHYHSTESPVIPGTPGGHAKAEDASLVAEENRTELPDATQNPDESFDTQKTPYKPNPNHVPMSPYWGHLQDHATLAMMGLSSPGGSMPPTPHRNGEPSSTQQDMTTGDLKNNLNAQPLLLRQQYYGYGYGNREGYPPPSPATQFMMSPQASFAYNYGYGFSPARPRPGTETKLLNTSISEEENDPLHGMPDGGNGVAEASPNLLKTELDTQPEVDGV